MPSAAQPAFDKPTSRFDARDPAALAWASKAQTGYALAVASVSATLLVRFGLDAFARFYYLPLLPAVMLPALFAPRRATILAIMLSVAANIFLVPEHSVADGVANAFLFAAIGLAIGELGRARQSLRAHAIKLKTRLNRREATLHAVLALAPVVTLDARSNIRSISAPACELFRTTERHAIGRPFKEFVELFEVGVVRFTPAGEPSIDDYWLGRKRDGDVFPLGIQQAFLGADPATSEVLLTLTDLSLWRSAELRSQKLRDQLNRVWRMNSLGEMAAIISHELNQPLAAAATYLQASQGDLARAGIYADSAGRTVELAKGQVLRAGAIVRRARELLTVEVQPLQAERMSSLIEDLRPILQLLGQSVGATVQIALDGAADEGLADRIQFQQAIVNLVRNAVEAVADCDRREVRIMGRAVSDSLYHVRVEDSGPGVTQVQLERLFEHMTTTKPKGMGLGLSITRKIVENHGGVLAVERSDLGGAAFFFSVQRATEAPAP